MIRDRKTAWLVFAGILVAVFEFFSLAGYKLPPLQAFPFFLLIILVIGWEVIKKGVKALFHLNFKSINLLMVIAVAGAFYLGEYEEAAVVIVLFSLAERLEDVGIAKSKTALDRLVDKMPKTALLKEGERIVDASQVKVGQIIVVKPFQMIPLDGVVQSGDSFVDESSITGEPIPQDKQKGSEVFAGTLNKNGYLEISVNKPSDQSTLAKIRDLTFDAMQHKAKTQKFIEIFSTYYTPGIILLAAFWTIFPWLAGFRTFLDGFSQSLTLLVISCPCALVISTPISIYSAIGHASSIGVLVKGGRYLEELARIKAIAFDKTRTLTFGEPIVTDVIPFGNHTREDLLSCAAGVELFSEHPLAQSIVEAAKREELEPHRVEDFQSIVGKGAKANCLVCYDRHHCIGKLKFILEEHHVPEHILAKIEELQNQGKTVIVISSHEEVEGIIAIEDEVRPESPDVVLALKKMGIHPCILTGDHLLTAKSVGGVVGIEDVQAELLPEDKARAVEDLGKKHRFVGMVGDGVNDAPALAMANVGISMSSLGSDTAIEAASIVILSDHLNRIPYLIKLGKKTLNYIRFNTLFAVLVKFLFIFLALLGLTNLALAIFADVGVTLIVILNSLRLMRPSII